MSRRLSNFIRSNSYRCNCKNNGTNAATFTANAAEPAGTITYNIVSGVAGSTCTLPPGSLATPACPLTCTNPTVLTVNSCIGAGTVTFTQTGGATSGTGLYPRRHY
ncbi:MAG: hypothetical protein IPL08_10465 [Saprospiraceae bacterium]|nr:hypothetical protein [Saprospiraceae bacterium]